MYLPKLIPYDIKKRTLYKFRGINRNKYCENNEFGDTLNLCSCDYPVLSSVPERYLVDETDKNDADEVMMFYNNGRGYIIGKGEDYTLNYKGCDITSFNFGSNIYPENVLNFNTKTLFVKKDRHYEFDTQSLEVDEFGCSFDFEYVKNGEVFSGRGARISLVYEDFGEINKFSTGTENSDFPSDAKEGDLFARYLSFYRFAQNGMQNEWVYQTSLRLRLDLGADLRKFKKGDYIKLSGLKYWNWAIRSFEELERFLRIDEIDEDGRYITETIEIFGYMVDILTKREYPGNNIVGYDNPYIDNIGNDLYLLEGNISACMPEMDFMLCGANRVWGCSNSTREIYASELGNSRNWSVFEGISSDSYAASVATPGDFTACVNYLGVPVFFKENEMIIVNGSRPASFQLCSYSYRGVCADSPGGVCVVNDILYYKSHDGIYAYSGSKPLCVSECMGEEIKSVKSVLMAGEGDYLFISGEYNGENVHYAYDTLRDIWHKYSAQKTYGYLRYPDATLEFSENNGKIGAFTLYKGIPDSVNKENAVSLENEWYWESGDICCNTPNKKYVGRISIDTECSGPSELFISYNGKAYKKTGSFPPHKRGCCDISIFAQRCERFRLRMKGKGKFSMYSITSEIEEAEENGR